MCDFACGSVIFAGCVEKSVVTWGGGAYGEFGYGFKGKKFSVNFDLVFFLEGKMMCCVVCGNGYMFFLVDKEDVKDLFVFIFGSD